MNNNKKELGETIREHIKNLGYKQIEVCKVTGLSPSRLSNYLSGSREPDFATLCKIADALGVELNDFRTDASRKKHEQILQAFRDGNAECTVIVRTMYGQIKTDVSSNNLYELLSNSK